MAVFLLLGSLALLHYLLLDGLDGLLFSMVTEESTYYSPGYSSKSFRRVQIGMSQREVRDLLGEPLREYPVDGGRRKGWLYSWKRADSSYRERVILFESGKVVRKYSDYYVD